MQHFIHVSAAQLIEKILEVWSKNREYPARYKDSDSFIKMALSEIVEEEGLKLISFTKLKKGDMYVCEAYKKGLVLAKKDSNWLDKTFLEFFDEASSQYGLISVRLHNFLAHYLESLNGSLSLRDNLFNLAQHKEYTKKIQTELAEVLLKNFNISRKELKAIGFFRY